MVHYVKFGQAGKSSPLKYMPVVPCDLVFLV